MIATGTDRLIRDAEQSVAFGDKTFEVIKKIVYLGSLVTPNNDVSLESHKRILLWTAQIITVGRTSLLLKFIIYKTLIRPVLLCGSET
jgi:hypothetical protein